MTDTDADAPDAPESLPNYLADGLPKQDHTAVKPSPTTSSPTTPSLPMAAARHQTPSSGRAYERPPLSEPVWLAQNASCYAHSCHLTVPHR
jgi:hypothetical protein